MNSIPVRLCGLLLLAFSLNQLVTAQDSPRPSDNGQRWTITTPEGGTKTLDARLIALKKGFVLLEDSGGKRHSMPLARLSEKDRKAALIDRVGSGVVVIKTHDVFGSEAGFASGFVIHGSGMILTNYHVVAGAGSVKVGFRDANEELTAEVLGIDRKNDLALLRVDRLPEGVHVVEISAGDLPEQGSTVWTIGHPGGLKNTVGWGDVNAVRKTSELPENLRKVLRAPSDTRWLQTDAIIARGSSGGPILNASGQAVGINTFVVGPQLGFAVHVSHARQVYLDGRSARPSRLPLTPSDDESALRWLSAEVAPIIKAYSEELATLRNETTGQPEQAYARFEVLRTKYREQLLKKAMTLEASSWPALQALAYATSFCDTQDADACLKEVCGLALKNHQGQKHLSAVVEAASKIPNDIARQFCRQVVDTSPHEAVRFSARAGLASNLVRWLAMPDTMDLSKLQQARKDIESLLVEIEESTGKNDGPISSELGKSLTSTLRSELARHGVGLVAPDIKGVDSQGKPFKLGDYRGKVVMLDFFADWCPHCRRMYPHERELVKKLENRPFELLGISCESERVLTRLVSDGTLTWRNWADGEQGPIAQSWSIEGFPTIVLVDHNGIIRWRSAGVPEADDLSRRIEQLVAEAEAGR